MKDALELLKTRNCIRKFKSKMVEDEKIEKCLEAARWAPSAANRQPWEFIIVKNQKTRHKLAELRVHGKFVKDSPVIFIPVSNPETDENHHILDTSLTALQYMLEAHSLGLGTCWASVLNFPIEEEVKEILDIPAHLRVICMIATGYPDQEPNVTRKPLKDLVHHEKYSK